MNWQPIETAPKDEARFLGYDPDGRIDVYWFYKWADGKVELQAHRGEGFSMTLTHWMPLPEPPK